MRYQLLFGLVLTFFIWLNNGSIAYAQLPLEIVTTTADLKSLVEVVGGELVHVTSLLPPNQDPHAFEPKLSDRQAIQKSQLVVRVGLDHDIWLDTILKDVKNPDLQRGGNGYVDTSVGIAVLEAKSLSLAPATGHDHGAGNPHYWLDPLNAESITGAIEEGLIRLDADHTEDYALNRDRFLIELKNRVKIWSDRLAPYRSNPIVVYHNSWPYLARRFRLKTIGYIEPKTGVPPSPTHLSELVRLIREQKVAVVIKEPYESDNITRYLNRTTGSKTLTLAASVGAVPEAKDYFSLFDYNVEQLIKGFSK
ncbi:zinc ABC transporter substrate-binding protein [Pseudanabaena sp. FACHB-1998]|uniref:metal ABC transporter substrate-binding protein n=1 Tax=Pseudanabaena sp. FACHB-1998 TaxID=2692858 RepID=UPI001680F877|nr:metal ABC transporter substrate-binding protein [Pseudanabaena sp. FACHB-1998]MBD2176702.1 zinc ABC transporter substrate-binding protein [Pseudanabaena sp. FACHB-1998]